MIYGIDLSKHNGTVDFKKVKKQGVKFVILRCGYASLSSRSKLYKDEKFEEYYKQAKKEGLHIGVYFYSRCNSKILGLAEAKFILSTIKGKEIDYPVWLDVEDKATFGTVARETLTQSIITCLDYIKKQGYYTGIYTGQYILRDNLIESKLTKYDKWIAQWGKTCTYKGSYGMWQFGGETNLLKPAKVQGVSSKCCDQNYALIDYAKVIRGKGLNGLKATGFKGLTVARLNVRKGASTQYKIITTLNKGICVEIERVQGNWGYVSKYKGWVCLDYIKR